MALIVFFLWRTMKLMPRTKPQEIKPDSKASIGWDDVAGADEAKAELQEVVDFLRDPERFHELGAKVPKGILLHGPPGTGKTLLAKAVANESGAQFFSQSAASLRRDVRRPRRRPHPAPVRRGAQAPPGDRLHRRDRRRRRRSAAPTTTPSASRRSTSCWSRWTASARAATLVVIAASNLLEKLDPALLRPGRFDRQVFVSPPDVDGREAILRVHTRGKPLGADVDLELVARQTAGPDRRRPRQHLQRGGDLRRPRAPRRAIGQARLRRRARARRRRHAVAPHAQRARAPRRRVPRGRPCAVRRAAARRRPRAQDLDRPARPRARLHAQPPGGGPLPQDARRADRPAWSCCSAAARPRRSCSARHHRRVRRPRARSPRSRARWSTSTRWARRSARCSSPPRAARCPTARASCATRSSSTSPTRRCAARAS